MSPLLIAVPKFHFAFFVVPVLYGVPLLWRYLTRKPVTRREIVHAVCTIVAVEGWMALSNVAAAAYKAKVMSLPTTIATVALLFVIVVVGSLYLVERHYPEYPEEETKG